MSVASGPWAWYDMDFPNVFRAAATGDDAALEQLLGRYRNYLLLLARMHVTANIQSKADPSDLVQETCMLAARDIASFRGETEEEFVAWLRTILAHTGATMIRRYTQAKRRDVQRELQLRQRLDRSSAALGKLLADDVGTPSNIAMRHEAELDVANALARIPELYREVLVMYHLQGLSVADISRTLGISEGSIRGYRTRAILKLRSLLKEP